MPPQTITPPAYRSNPSNPLPPTHPGPLTGSIPEIRHAHLTKRTHLLFLDLQTQLAHPNPGGCDGVYQFFVEEVGEFWCVSVRRGRCRVRGGMVGVPDWELGVGFEGLRGVVEGGVGCECSVEGEVGRGGEAEGMVEGGKEETGMGETGEGKAGGEKQKVRGEEERKWHKVEPEGGEAKSERNRREMIRRLGVLFPRQKGMGGSMLPSDFRTTGAWEDDVEDGLVMMPQRTGEVDLRRWVTSQNIDLEMMRP